MNREQAVEINEHLLGAYEALEHARRAIAGLGKAERLEFGRSLEVVDCALQLGLLRALYDQYPDLEPPEENEESPKITSELRWDKVCLPATLTEAEFDQVILSTMSHHWRKVARIVVDVVKRFEHLGQAIN